MTELHLPAPAAILDRRGFLALAGAIGIVTVAAPAAAAPARKKARENWYRFASTRLRVPNRQITLSGTNRAALWRQSAGSPPYVVRNPRVCLPGFYCFNGGGTGPTERINEGSFDVAYALELDGVRYRATFGGQDWTSRGGTGADHGYGTDFDWGVWSDPIPVEIPPNSNLFHCTLLTVATAGTAFPAALRLSPLIGDRARVAADETSLEPLLSGPDPINTAGSSPSTVYSPMFMVAEDASANPVVLIVGDSRAYGAVEMAWGNQEPRAPLAAVERGLDSDVGGRIATGNITVPGSAPGHTTIAPGVTHRTTPLLELAAEHGGLPFTHIVDQHGNNGSLSWTSLATHVTATRAIFPSASYVKVTIPPRVGQNTTDAYRTVAGQNPSAGDSYPDGARALLNNDILANRDGLFDEVFHAGAYGMAGDDTDFNRSRFPEFPLRKGQLTRDWSGSGPLTVNFEPLIGDRLNFDPAERNAGGIVQTVTPTATAGEWEVVLELGFPTGTAYPGGTLFACTPTADGTHESPRVSMIEAAAYEDMKQARVFGRIATPHGRKK